MAILEKEVLVKCGYRTDKYYEDLGYEMPRQINKQGQLRTIMGSLILVKIDDLPQGSSIKVTKICDDCGKHIPNQSYNNIMRYREQSGKDICLQCSKNVVWKTRYKNMSYEKSLEYYAKTKNMEYLLNEFSDKNDKKPNEISYGSNIECIWDCFVCNGEYYMNVWSKTGLKSGCPYCTRQRVLVGFNDLWTTHPEVARLLKDEDRGYEVLAHSNKKEEFICEKCKHISYKDIGYVVDKGFSCARCSDGISYPEKFMMNILDQLNIEYETQKVFEWSQNKQYDFYIPSLKMIIETHGRQHYEEVFVHINARKLDEEQENDKLKEQLARENYIKNYVTIDCRESDLKFIKSNILNSKLNKLFNLNSVDWLKSHEYALSTLVKEVSDIWNSGIRNALEISKLIKLSRNTTIRYLKQGAELDWCDYNPKEEMKNSAKANSQNNNRKIIQLSLNNIFIKEWNSIGEAQEELMINNISMVCRNIRKKAGGFRWMYKEDYENLLKEKELIEV